MATRRAGVAYNTCMQVADHPKLTKKAFLKFAEGYKIQRWNDRARTGQLVELDHFGQKMMLAYIIGTLEEEKNNTLDWGTIIYGGILHYIRKLKYFDMKPEVWSSIIKSIQDEDKDFDPYYEALRDWESLIPNNLWTTLKESSESLNKLGSSLRDEEGGDWSQFSKKGPKELAYSVLYAAHKLASYWEFLSIRPINSHNPETEDTSRELLKEIQALDYLDGVARMLNDNTRLSRFFGKISNLRYQQRWSHTYKQPPSTVMGHSALVSLFSALFLHFIGMSRKTHCRPLIENTFWGALFHDLPEAATRDIVKPVKEALQKKGKEDLIRRTEMKLFRELLVTIYDENGPSHANYKKLYDRIIYYSTGILDIAKASLEDDSEFNDRYIDSGQVVFESTKDFINLCDLAEDKKQVSGRIIRLSDILAAYIEATQSIKAGIQDDEFQGAVQRIRDLITQTKIDVEYYGVDLKHILTDITGE